MFVCEKCGELETEWCDTCNKIASCDCSDSTTTRFKDLIYDTESGEKTITVYLYHCATCGMVDYVSQ